MAYCVMRVGDVASSRCMTAGASITYTVNVVNKGNVNIRGMQLAVTELSSSTSNGIITCVDASNVPWATADLSAGGSLTCTGKYVLDQDAIEHGDLHPSINVTASNLAKSVTASLPAIIVPNLPSLSVSVDASTCTKPQNAGMCYLD